MRRRVLMFLFVWEPLAELAWAWLRYLDNRRKNKPLSDPWQRIWMKFVYDSSYGTSVIHGDPDGDFALSWPRLDTYGWDGPYKGRLTRKQREFFRRFYAFPRSYT